MSGRISAARQRGQHLLAAAGTVAAMARDDLAWLTVQAGRKLPSAARSRLGGRATRSRGVLGAWGELLLDRPDKARERLSRLPRSGPLAATLAVHAGTAPGPDAPAGQRARWAWLTGDLTRLRQLLEEGALPHRLDRRVRGDLEALTGGPRPVPAARRDWPVGGEVGATGQHRPLHVLTNSLPWTRSGYALRTHAILTAQRDAGMAVAAMTRPAYPVSIGKVLSTDVDVVDGIAYRRCVPAGLPPGEAERVDVWAEHLVRLAREHRATVLHSTTHYPNALAAQAAARALGLPWVHEVRGQLERTWASGRQRHGDADPYGSERFAAWRAREAEVAAQADHVITLSEVMRQDLAARGVDPARVTVVPNGIDPALLERDIDPAEARRRLGLPVEGLWVGAVSSVVHYEGFDTLLDAVALARRDGLDVRVAIVGDGLAWPGLKEQAQRLGIAGHVLLPGRLPRAESLRWLDALDVVVVPRHDHEVTRLVPPLKVAEAMGAGRPVIASDLPALGELVRDGETGLLVPAGEVSAVAAALARLHQDADPLVQVVGAGRAAAAELNWTNLVGRHASGYSSATGWRDQRASWGKM